MDALFFQAIVLLAYIPNVRLSLISTGGMKEHVYGTRRHYSIAFHIFVVVMAQYHGIMTGIAYGSLFNNVYHGMVFLSTGGTFSVCKHIARYMFLI